MYNIKRFILNVRLQTFAQYEESETNSMLHNGLLDLMNRSTCFGHYYAHRQELATIQMVPQRVAPHLGYGRLLVWCMAVSLIVRVEGCFTTGCAVYTQYTIVMPETC